MASKRNRIIEIKDYIESFGIEVNVGKNKARGNKGFFKVRDKSFRIDISTELSEEAVISTLLHEFVHFIHYKYDTSLKKLDFIFDKLDDDLTDELIKVTVDSIPQKLVTPLFSELEKVKKEFENISQEIPFTNPQHKKNKYIDIEKSIEKTKYKYLLKYDRVQFKNLFGQKIYSVNDLNNYKLSELQIKYIRLKSKQRALRRIQSRINKLNRYYNSPTELLARSIELYIADNKKLAKISPKLYNHITNIINSDKIPELTNIIKIINTKS